MRKLILASLFFLAAAALCPADSSSIVLSWTPTTTACVSPCTAITYSVFRGITSGSEDYTNAVASGITGTSFTDSHVVLGQTYFYTVETVESESGQGPVASVPSAEAAATFSQEAFDEYGGSLDLSCPARASEDWNHERGQLYTRAISSVSGSGTTITVTVPAGAFEKGDAVILSGTGTGLDTPAGTVDNIASTTAGTFPNITSFTIASTRTGSASTGTLALAGWYTALINNHWWMCTPLSHGMPLNDVDVIAPSPWGTDLTGINDNDIYLNKYAQNLDVDPSLPKPANAKLNWCMNRMILMKQWGLNFFGVDSDANCEPNTSNNQWGTPDNYPPPQMYMAMSGGVVQNFRWSFLNVNSLLTGNPEKALSSMEKGSIETQFNRGGVDTEDPQFSAWVNANQNSPSTALHFDYMALKVMDESDQTMGTGGADDFPSLLSTYGTSKPQMQTNCCGHKDLELGAAVMDSSPLETAVGVRGWGRESIPSTAIVYATSTNYGGAENFSKNELATWLQGNTEAANATAASRSGSTVTLTFAARSYPQSEMPYFVTGEQITVRSCSDASFDTTAGTGAMVASWTPTQITFTLSGTGTSATGCVATSGPGYTLAGLNTAWGASYDTFGSDAVKHQQTICAGTWNGTQTSCSFTLATTPITPLTVMLDVNGTVEVGDDGSGNANGNGPRDGTVGPNGNLWIQGQGSASGAINYTTGAANITFVTAPANGATVTVTYETGGWGSGAGVLDEDLNHANHAWVWNPTNFYWPENGSESQMQKDLEGYNLHWMKHYFGLEFAALRTYHPGVLVESPTVGGWDAPAAREVYEAADAFVEILGSDLSDYDPTNDIGATALQARIDFLGQYFHGPAENQVGHSSLADSPYGGVTGRGDTNIPDFSSQPARAQAWVNYVNNNLLGSAFSAACNCSQVGVDPWIGFNWWSISNQGNGDNGWIDHRDNPYDGRADVWSIGMDSLGFPTGCVYYSQITAGTQPCETVCTGNTSSSCTNAPAFFGDFVDTARDANYLWLNLIPRTHVSGALGGTAH